MTLLTPGTLASSVFSHTPLTYLWGSADALEVGSSGVKLADTLAERFNFFEPWGSDIVTNGSQHEYPEDVEELIDREIVSVDQDQGDLVIRPVRKAGTDTMYSAVLSTQNFSGNQLGNNEKVSITARLAKGRGLWSAGWALPAFIFGQWPQAYSGLRLPEADIFEAPNLDGDNCYYANKHSYESRVPTGTLTENSVKHTCREGVDLFKDYHTYTLAREDDAIHYLFDDVVVASLPAFQEEIMQGPWILLLNLAVGGGWPGPFDVSQPVTDDMALRIKSVEFSKVERMLGTVAGNHDSLVELDKLQACVDTCFNQRRAALGGFPRD